MKKLFSICSTILFVVSIHASVTNVFHFSAINLPSQIGEYNCSYYSTNNLNVAAMLTLVTNNTGPTPPPEEPTWDFSQLQQSGETVLRTDIISPTNGVDGSFFLASTYSEQDTAISLIYTNQIAWRYYSITNQGRLYYGSYVPSTDADGLAQFDPPTPDIPATVTNGQSWTRSTSWNTTVYTIFGDYGIYYTFSETSSVDAFGTLILPNIGGMPAWRVHEVHAYAGYLDGYDLDEIVTNQYYYWLVPGLGVAAQITMYGNNVLYPTTMPFTNSVERMYYASYYTPIPPSNPVPATGNLHVRLQSGSAVLNWSPFTNNATSYLVEANGSLNSTNWLLLGLTSSTNWSDTLIPTQRFYRVVGFP
jgi:hypothetical protein